MVVYIIAIFYKRSHTDYTNSKYYFKALNIKLFSALCFALIFNFYYGGGDTFAYYYQSSIIVNAFWASPVIGLKLLATDYWNDPALRRMAFDIWWAQSLSEFFVIRVAVIIGLLSFNSFLATTFFFSFISFTGIWKLFVTFSEQYPDLRPQFAFACFYMPSVFFWGSALMKDSLCLGALGWLFGAFYQGIIKQKSIPKNVIIVLICSYCILCMKPYILMTFIPPALLWVFREFGSRIRSRVVRKLATPVMVIMALVAAYFGVSKLTESNEKYALDKIGERTKVTSDYLYRISQQENGSGYRLGELDGSIGSMLRLAPQAINVTLFRPYIWEVRSPFVLLSSLESMYFMYITLSLVLKTGLKKTIEMVSKIPVASFCLVFTLIFAFAVGINSNNFGSLVRYKIQMVPFYISGLTIANYHSKRYRTARMREFAEA